MSENWAKLAEAIGMVRFPESGEDTGYWEDLGNGDVLPADLLPAYLMEPAQTARILKAGHDWWWGISGRPGKWFVTLVFNQMTAPGHVSAGAGDFGEAVARCAAQALANNPGDPAVGLGVGKGTASS